LGPIKGNTLTCLQLKVNTLQCPDTAIVVLQIFNLQNRCHVRAPCRRHLFGTPAQSAFWRKHHEQHDEQAQEASPIFKVPSHFCAKSYQK